MTSIPLQVVSTSRTPGHTKHFQTIYLTPTVQLCDCPGLVFPSLVNKQIQVVHTDITAIPSFLLYKYEIVTMDTKIIMYTNA